MTRNPYLELFTQYQCDQKDWHIDFLGLDVSRHDICHKFAWAVPTDEAAQAIKCHTTEITEIGAGTGYWAWFLSQFGITVHAYDNMELNRQHLVHYHPVQIGDELMVDDHPGAALMLCWPPYAEWMAHNALDLYSGNLLIYIGEGRNGCTAESNFFDLLESKWRCIEEITIPQWMDYWDGMHDTVQIYRRKSH